MYVQDVIDIVAEVHPELDVSTLTKDSSFDALGLSSLQLTEVIMELEDKFEVEIDINTVDAAENMKTIADLASGLEAIIKEQS